MSHLSRLAKGVVKCRFQYHTSKILGSTNGRTNVVSEVEYMTEKFMYKYNLCIMRDVSPSLGTDALRTDMAVNVDMKIAKQQHSELAEVNICFTVY